MICNYIFSCYTFNRYLILIVNYLYYYTLLSKKVLLMSAQVRIPCTYYLFFPYHPGYPFRSLIAVIIQTLVIIYSLKFKLLYCTYLCPSYGFVDVYVKIK